MLSQCLVFSKRLSLLSSARMIPHPEKAHRGGEDAYFIGRNQLSIGVADGVGGWNGVPGADPAKFSRDLMKFCNEYCDLNNPQMILEAAEKKLDMSVKGSTTALVAKIIGRELHVCNVGDSSLCIFRNGRWIFQTADSVLGFNYPLQIGSLGKYHAKDGSYDRVQVSPGDIVVAATDGLWDNVWSTEIEKIVKKAVNEGLWKSIADILAETANRNGKNTNFYSPFAYEASQFGYKFKGGKLDDVTVVVSMVNE